MYFGAVRAVRVVAQCGVSWHPLSYSTVWCSALWYIVRPRNTYKLSPVRVLACNKKAFAFTKSLSLVLYGWLILSSDVKLPFCSKTGVVMLRSEVSFVILCWDVSPACPEPSTAELCWEPCTFELCCECVDDISMLCCEETSLSSFCFNVACYLALKARMQWSLLKNRLVAAISPYKEPQQVHKRYMILCIAKSTTK